jgi:integrase
MTTRKKQGLPPRVYQKHGAYYYVTPKHKWIRLGATKQEMLAKYYELIDRPTKIYTMNDLINRYMQEIAPTKAPRTYKDNQQEAERLRAVFKDMEPQDIAPVHIYQYLDERAKKARVRANREKALLSSMFNFAIRWGVIKDNPCRHVKRLTEKPRSRYIEDWEYKAFYELATPIIQVAMDFAYLTCQRVGDILEVQESDLSEEGITIIQNKSINGKSVPTKLLITWSDELRQCVNRAKQLRDIRSIYLFCRRDGKPYTYDGFSSMWQRIMDKALERGLLQERFTFHDIRAKSYSDEQTIEGRRRAGHKSLQMSGTYDRGAKKVTPLK